MKKLQRYVLKGIAQAFLLSFLTLALLMVVGFCMQLLHDGLDVVRLSSLLPPLFGYCIPIVLPSAFLTGVIMTFGRLSADNELIAVRAAGIHLFRVVYPVLVLGLLLSAVAGFFQFEMVPRARGAIKALKYEALRQMLLDKAALSWKRQFSFPPAHLQYDDFQDGKMTGVTVIEVRDQRPYTIISAASSTIRPHPEQHETVVFEMSDCVITRFDRQEYGEGRTFTVEGVIYSVRVAPKAEEIRTRRKHLPFRELLQEVRRLRQRVAGQARYDDPDSVRAEQAANRKRLDISIGELDAALQSSRGKHHKYAVQEPRGQRLIIEHTQNLLADAQHQFDELRQQQADCAEQLIQMHEGEADLERRFELERLQAALLTKIDAKDKEIAERKGEIAEAETLIEADEARAAEIQGQIAELQQRKGELVEDRKKIIEVIRAADDQRSLNAIRIRVHKRLAQALSVLIFALVGIPLGIVASGRSVMIAFGISFAIVLLIFYPFLILGQVAAEAGVLPIAPAMWAGNAFTFLIGAVLMVRVLSR